MDVSAFHAKSEETWQKIVAQYQHPERSRSLGQLFNTLIPYALL